MTIEFLQRMEVVRFSAHSKASTFLTVRSTTASVNAFAPISSWACARLLRRMVHAKGAGASVVRRWNTTRGAQKKWPGRSGRTEFLRKKSLRKTDEGGPLHSFKTLLNEMGTLCRNRCRSKSGGSAFLKNTHPTPLQSRVFDLIRMSPVTESWNSDIMLQYLCDRSKMCVEFRAKSTPDRWSRRQRKPLKRCGRIHKRKKSGCLVEVEGMLWNATLAR